MAIGWKVALAAAGLACGSSADAAFLTYTFNINGSGTREVFNLLNPAISTIQTLRDATITIGVTEFTGSSIAFGSDGFTSFDVLAEASRLSFSFRPSPNQSILFATGRGAACYLTPQPATFPTNPVPLGGGCSVSYNVDSPRGLYREFFGGSVSSFSVTRQDAGQSFISIVAFVPEPATWAMMLVGLGMIGYSLRRRRAMIAPAA